MPVDVDRQGRPVVGFTRGHIRQLYIGAPILSQNCNDTRRMPKVAYATVDMVAEGKI